MKWFKHDSNSRHDAKIQKLRMKYGLEGYGLYFYLLECIAGGVEPHNLTFELEEDAEIIANSTNLHVERIEEMMREMVKLKLFEVNNSGIITCLKMSMKADAYTEKVIRNNNKVRTLSVQSPDSVQTKSVLIEEKRREKKDKKVLDKPENVSVDTWSDFLEHRKAKKLPMTKTAITRITNEADKAGWTLEDALAETIARGWISFKADWVEQKQNKKQEWE